MLPNSRQNAKQNLLSTAKKIATALFCTLLGGCFQQSAPERIPTATTPEDCLATAETLQFAHLSAAYGKLDSFPEGLDRCPALWKLSLRGQTALAPLPAAVADCKGLRWLDLSEMSLKDLPEELKTLPLQRLYLADNALDALPGAVASLASLDYLNLDRNHLTSLPDAVGSWTSLRWLRLNGNRLAALPASAASWTSLQRLYLRDNALAAVPAAITALPALEQLDLGGNHDLATISDDIGNLPALTRLDLDHTAVAHLPDSVASLTNLNTLVLVGCPMDTNEVARIKKLLPGKCRVEF